ncbi:MAG TPA: radical SAM protein, partial [Candidatus Methanofastidiosa archaeon]|nr:radical SAM protein [Candidatus Methanofastidiosa archaeon]
SSWIDGVVITGGEPTCYSGLADLAEEIRSMGLKVKLDTNGTRPDVIRKLLDQNLFDHISLDVKNSFGKYSETAGAEVNTDDIMESIRLIMEFDDYEMRTTVVPGLVCPEDLEEICSYIKGSDIYVLQRFHPENIKDKRFSALPPQNDDEMEHLRSLCSRHVRTVWRN